MRLMFFLVFFVSKNILLKNEKDLEINETNIQIQMQKVDSKWEIKNPEDLYIGLYGGNGEVKDLPDRN